MDLLKHGLCAAPAGGIYWQSDGNLRASFGRKTTHGKRGMSSCGVNIFSQKDGLKSHMGMEKSVPILPSSTGMPETRKTFQATWMKHSSRCKDIEKISKDAADVLRSMKEATCICLCGMSVATVAAAGVLLLQPGPALASGSLADLSYHSSMERTLVEAWRIVRDSYVDPTFNEQDWQAKFQETFDELTAKSLANDVVSLPATDGSVEDGSPPQPKDGSLDLKITGVDEGEAAGYKRIGRMLSALGDPFTRIITPRQYESFIVKNDGSLQGVGLIIGLEQRTGRVLVLHSIDGSPAARAGLRAGDELLQINNELVTGLKSDEAASKLRGKAGTTVTLKLARKSTEGPAGAASGEAISEVTLRREQIRLSPVTAAVLDYAPEGMGPKKVGYIRLSHFSQNAADDMEAAIQSLEEKEGVKAFILDLRDNPGGVVKVGLDVAQMWLDGDKILVNIIERDGIPRAVTSVHSHALTNDPLVVLVNKNSASASEILAAALHDNGRALLVGSKTYGKGKIQTVTELSDGSALFVTVAKYVSPALHPIDQVGIVPDVLCTSDPLEADPSPDSQAVKKTQLLIKIMIMNSKEELPGYLLHDSCLLLAEHQLNETLAVHSSS